ncbi:TIGR03545 family protein [Aliikangiella sp. IMCC44359]|uniref:TIGR03545 family protein n=1 Tax=Aliikangiella sp. IMCC44359 TaxID=3459125 RepID=UPI00403AF2C3
MKLIRWWGLAVFFSIILLVVLLWYLLAPRIVESSIEQLGSEALGAKVEIDSVNLSLFPIAVTLKHLVAADPDAPMTNLFESSEITFAVDSERLLWKKLIIEELVIDGVQTGTARKTSGALEGGRKSGKAVEQVIEMVIPDVEKINIKELVNDADLITLKRIEKLKQEQSKVQSEWKNALDKDELEKRTEEIKKEYKRLSDRAKENKLNLIKDRKDWKKLKKLIDAERKQISVLSDKLKQDKTKLAEQLKDVKNGPNDDLDLIMEKFGLGNGIDGLVDKYLGPQYTPWVKRILGLVKQVKPANSEQQVDEEKAYVQVGKKVYFKDQKTFPELLIKKIKLNGSDNGRVLDGRGFDLGYLPWLTGKPAKLNLRFSGNGQANIDVSSHWPSAKDMQSKLNSQVVAWPIDKMQFMQTDKGDWTIDSGTLSATVNGELTLQTIDLKAIFSIQSPKLVFPKGLSDWQTTLANSINQQKKIDFKLIASGDIENPKITVSSSIEKLFQQAIGEKVKQKAQKLTGKVKAAITEKIGDISALESFDGNFDNWQKQLGDNDKLLKDILGKIN